MARFIMIKNERQYRITKTQAKKFAIALSDAQSKEYTEPLLAELERNALKSQLDELSQQIDEYEELQAGTRSVIDVDSFAELPDALVKARIAAGLSQKNLADRLELKEQQIQRYEATDYRTASLSRLQEIVQALGISVRGKVFLPNQRQMEVV
jgi:DNA-binding XRE family transcriptional regulator